MSRLIRWKKIREGSLTFIYLVCYSDSDLPFHSQYYPWYLLSVQWTNHSSIFHIIKLPFFPFLISGEGYITCSDDRFHTSDSWLVQSEVYDDKDDLKAIFWEPGLFRSPFIPWSKGESSVGVSWNATPFEFLLTQIRDCVPLTTSYCECRPGTNKKGLFIIPTAKSNLSFGYHSFITNQSLRCLHPFPLLYRIRILIFSLPLIKSKQFAINEIKMSISSTPCRIITFF